MELVTNKERQALIKELLMLRRERERDRTFYYTNEEMVKDLIGMTPIEVDDVVLDAGSGKNKVWFNNLVCIKKYECEIEDGCDFYKWDKKVDWIVGNPPFRDKAMGNNLIASWIEKASEVAERGMAFLINHKVFNTLTPRRLEKLREKGFYLQKIHTVSDKRWFGRYYYRIFTKNPSDLVTWSLKNYK